MTTDAKTTLEHALNDAERAALIAELEDAWRAFDAATAAGQNTTALDERIDALLDRLDLEEVEQRLANFDPAQAHTLDELREIVQRRAAPSEAAPNAQAACGLKSKASRPGRPAFRCFRR